MLIRQASVGDRVPDGSGRRSTVIDRILSLCFSYRFEKSMADGTGYRPIRQQLVVFNPFEIILLTLSNKAGNESKTPWRWPEKGRNVKRFPEIAKRFRLFEELFRWRLPMTAVRGALVTTLLTTFQEGRTMQCQLPHG